MPLSTVGSPVCVNDCYNLLMKVMERPREERHLSKVNNTNVLPSRACLQNCYHMLPMSVVGLKADVTLREV